MELGWGARGTRYSAWHPGTAGLHHLVPRKAATVSPAIILLDEAVLSSCGRETKPQEESGHQHLGLPEDGLRQRQEGPTGPTSQPTEDALRGPPLPASPLPLPGLSWYWCSAEARIPPPGPLAGGWPCLSPPEERKEAHTRPLPDLHGDHPNPHMYAHEHHCGSSSSPPSRASTQPRAYQTSTNTRTEGQGGRGKAAGWRDCGRALGFQHGLPISTGKAAGPGFAPS